MADDDATRARRYRAHKSGDHSLCLVGSCDDAAPEPAGLADGEVGPVEEAVVEFAATLPLE